MAVFFAQPGDIPPSPGNIPRGSDRYSHFAEDISSYSSGNADTVTVKPSKAPVDLRSLGIQLFAVFTSSALARLGLKLFK